MEERQGSNKKRILSRVIDYSIFALTAQGIVSIFIPFLDLWQLLLGALCIPLLYIPVEALQLYLWQTTLGKALLGLTVREEGKKKLSLKGAFKAALSVFKPSVRFSTLVTNKRRGKVLSLLMSLLLMGGLTFNNFIMPVSMGSSMVALTIGWTKFVSKDGKFSVDMPSKPDFHLREFPVPPAGITLTLSEYTAKVDGKENESYSVNYVTLPRSWLLASSKRILFGGLYLKYETQLGSDVLSKREAKHWNRFPAVDFVAKQNGQRIQGRLILAGNRLFQISKSTPMSAKVETKKTANDGEKTPDENFIESFNPLLR